MSSVTYFYMSSVTLFLHELSYMFYMNSLNVLYELNYMFLH